MCTVAPTRRHQNHLTPNRWIEAFARTLFALSTYTRKLRHCNIDEFLTINYPFIIKYIESAIVVWVVNEFPIGLHKQSEV